MKKINLNLMTLQDLDKKINFLCEIFQADGVGEIFTKRMSLKGFSFQLS